MSKHSEPQRPKDRLSRRRFMQSTALLTGLSIGGQPIAGSSPVQAQERAVPETKVAQVPTVAGPRAAAPSTSALPVQPPISLEDFIKISEVLTVLNRLEPDLAAQYLQRCADNPEVSGQLENLVQFWSSLKE